MLYFLSVFGETNCQTDHCMTNNKREKNNKIIVNNENMQLSLCSSKLNYKIKEKNEINTKELHHLHNKQAYFHYNYHVVQINSIQFCGTFLVISIHSRFDATQKKLF